MSELDEKLKEYKLEGGKYGTYLTSRKYCYQLSDEEIKWTIDRHEIKYLGDNI